MNPTIGNIAQIERLNRWAEAYCKQSVDFHKFVQGRFAIGKTCSFVNLVKYILENRLAFSVDHHFVRRHKGIYAFSLRIIADMQLYQTNLKNFQVKKLERLILWKYIFD